jgi:hypothetical protein
MYKLNKRTRTNRPLQAVLLLIIGGLIGIYCATWYISNHLPMRAEPTPETINIMKPRPMSEVLYTEDEVRTINPEHYQMYNAEYQHNIINNER